MGAQLFTITQKGTDVKEVFNKLVEDAIYEYGNDLYNGTISTTSLGSEIRLPDRLKKAIREKDWETVESYDYLTFPEKRRSQYSKTLAYYQAYVPRWESDRESVKRQKGVRNIQQYSIEIDGQFHVIQYDRYDTLTEAKRKAREVSLSRGVSVIVKQLRSDESSFRLGRMNLVTDGKKYKSARKAKHRVYLPTYEFKFYVYAAE